MSLWKTVTLGVVDHFLGDDTRSRTGFGILEGNGVVEGRPPSPKGKYFHISITCNKEDDSATESFYGVNSREVDATCNCCQARFTVSTPGNGKMGLGYTPDSFHRITYTEIGYYN